MSSYGYNGVGNQGVRSMPSSSFQNQGGMSYSNQSDIPLQPPFDYARGPDSESGDFSMGEFNPMKEIQRKQNHNEAEKKRVRNINKCVEDLKTILDKANVPHRTDKVSALEASVTYLRDLIKERDRLTTNLGYMDSLVSTGVSGDEAVTSDDDDNHFLKHSIDPSDMTAAGIDMDVEKPCVSFPANANGDAPKPCDLPCNQSDGQKNSPVAVSCEKELKQQGVDYKSIWMNGTMPCLIVQINSGKLLKGNNFFMKMFAFDTIDELNRLSFFDIISPSDLSIFWSEYSQLVNSHQQMTRAFVCIVKNPAKNIQLPCLLTMGSIMDFEGHIFQVAASLTPLKQVDSRHIPTEVKRETEKSAVNISKFI